MQISDLKNYTVVGSSGAPTVPTQPQAPQSLGQKIGNAAQGVTDFVGAKGIADEFGATLARAKAPEAQKGLVDFPTGKQVLGSAIQTGANLIPGLGAEAGLAGKIAAGAGTGYAFDVGNKLQNNKENPLMPGVGTAVGGGLPVVGAGVNLGAKVVGRLLKGLGSGLSGVSTDTINSIVNNPEMAQKASDRLAQNGNSKFLEDNARTIVNGVSGVRKQAREAFGNGLEQLSKEDIKPDVFRGETQKVLDKYGVSSSKGKRVLSGVEFEDPKLMDKASGLIDRLQNADLNGRSLRKLSNDIENAKFKTTGTSAERLSFNAFIKDLSSGLDNAISNSTDKLGEINKNFSQDMQLTKAVEDIFGKVKFKNLPEVVKASQKLEGLFAQKGLAPDVVDKFLSRIGVNPADFKTGEAVRQISNKSSGANTKGLSVGELMQQTTSAVVTPEMVKQISIKTGMAKEKLIPFLKGMKTPARNAVIQALLSAQEDSSQQQPQ